jgi:glycosyltransferase involved in cell wall biosynthesis
MSFLKTKASQRPIGGTAGGLRHALSRVYPLRHEPDATTTKQRAERVGAIERPVTASKLLVVATEDWFILSHFMPLVARACADGYQPVLAARLSAAAQRLTAQGVALRPLASLRTGLSPFAIGAQAQAVRTILAEEKPAVVHAIGLKPCLLAALAADAAPRAGFVFAVIGMGYLACSRAPAQVLLRRALTSLLAQRAEALGARLVFENMHDRREFLKRGVPLEHTLLSPGAGVDPARYVVRPEPPSPPYRVGFAARLVKSKGVEVALGAIAVLRARGAPVVLSIAGAPDPDNPASFTETDLAAWCADGVKCLGWTTDMPAFWANTHVAIVPSLGGDGLPKTLLEAAACGRATVTTDVPGCRDFMRDGELGFITKRGDADALARAVERFIGDPELRARLGAAARREVEAKYTSGQMADVMSVAWAGARRRHMA